MEEKRTPCKFCEREIYNENIDWSGYCSEDCEMMYKREERLLFEINGGKNGK